VAEAGIGQQTAGSRDVALADEDPARQDSDRSFEHAHIAVENEMRDCCAVE